MTETFVGTENTKKVKKSKLIVKGEDLTIKGCTIHIEGAFARTAVEKVSVVMPNNSSTMKFDGEEAIDLLVSDIYASLGDQYNTLQDKADKRHDKEDDKKNSKVNENEEENDSKVEPTVTIMNGITIYDYSKPAKEEKKSIEMVFGIPLYIEKEEKLLSLSPAFEPDIREAQTRV
ncbi:MAG: hypothetical protein E6L02_08075 [Thaumarchaeota archaeon]|nr:MAG: hypothetical protein E6L02_08075 [Nitrososphaerota archaeon]